MRIDTPKLYRYYKRVIRANELKYIKQEHLNGEVMNITDSKMFAEVDDYNGHAMMMRVKKKMFNIDYWGLLIANIIFFCAELFVVLSLDSLGGKSLYSPLYGLTGSRMLCLLTAVIAFAAMVYFVYMRKNFSRILMSVLTVTLSFVSLLFAAVAIADIILVRILRELYDDMKDDAGFPYFINIVTSYIRDDDGSEDGTMDDAEEKYSFEKYKRNIDDDEIIL